MWQYLVVSSVGVGSWMGFWTPFPSIWNLSILFKVILFLRLEALMLYNFPFSSPCFPLWGLNYLCCSTSLLAETSSWEALDISYLKIRYFCLGIASKHTKNMCENKVRDNDCKMISEKMLFRLWSISSPNMLGESLNMFSSLNDHRHNS